jgi:hypothetical protein
MKKWFVIFLLSVFLFSPMAVYGFALDTSCWVGEETEDEENEGETVNTFVTTAPLNLRPAPTTDVPRIVLAPQGSLVQVTDFRDGEWYAVIFNGYSGFMFAEFLKPYNIIPFVAPDLDNLAPVEIVDWHTANGLFPFNESVTVIDVRTGTSWQVARFGGDLHADVETVTAEDTANMLRAFNHRWTWDPRPILVIIDGRTLAASIGGMPHGIVTNFRNNVHGHFCLHFFGSLVHGASGVDPRHHNAVIEAFLTFTL